MEMEFIPSQGSKRRPSSDTRNTQAAGNKRTSKSESHTASVDPDILPPDGNTVQLIEDGPYKLER